LRHHCQNQVPSLLDLLPVDEQAAHSNRTGQLHYGRGFQEQLQTTASRELGFWTVSTLWQQLIGTSLHAIAIARPPAAPTAPTTTTTTTTATSSSARTTPRTSATYQSTSSPNLRDTLALQTLLREVQGEHASFKTPHQLIATHHLVMTRSDLVHIAPTGSGKTWVYLTAAQAMPTKTMIAIIPLKALRGDLELRLIALPHVDSVTWTGQQPDHDPTLLLVSTEAVGSSTFRDYLARLHALRRLSWVVVDEVHLLLTERAYRPALGEVLALRRQSFPLLLLSASLPPVLEERLKEELSSQFVTLRVSCDRPNLTYQVHLVDNLQQVLTETWHEIMNSLGDLDEEEENNRLIVYVSRKADAEALVKVINGQIGHRVHHSDLSAKEKEEAVSDWRNGAVKIMIATKGFGVGVDYPHVRVVIHLGGSSSVLDYAQETGRAGRDGKVSYAKLITFKNFHLLLGLPSHPLAPLLSGNCLRQEISRAVDRDMVAPCALGNQVAHCQHCREGHTLLFCFVNISCQLAHSSSLFAPQRLNLFFPTRVHDHPPTQVAFPLSP